MTIGHSATSRSSDSRGHTTERTESSRLVQKTIVPIGSPNKTDLNQWSRRYKLVASACDSVWGYVRDGACTRLHAHKPRHNQASYEHEFFFWLASQLRPRRARNGYGGAQKAGSAWRKTCTYVRGAQKRWPPARCQWRLALRGSTCRLHGQWDKPRAWGPKGPRSPTN